MELLQYIMCVVMGIMIIGLNEVKSTQPMDASKCLLYILILIIWPMAICCLINLYCEGRLF